MGNAVQTCSAAGRWVSSETCMFVCSGAGVCGGQCVPGRRQCVGTMPQVCSTDGQWTNAGGNECLGAIGASCGSGGECMSGDCVDGVCCENGCAGTCMSCLNSAHGAGNGRCRNVRSGSDPNNECADGTCRTGTCNGSGACGLTPNGQSGPGCSGATRCSGSSDLLLGSTCQNGSCMGGGTRDCGYKGCTNDQCRNSCPDRTNDTGSLCEPCGRNDEPCCTRGNTCNDLSRQICRSNTERCSPCSTPESVGDSCCGVQRTHPDGLFATERGTCPSGQVCMESMGNSPGWFCSPP
jgi:hypothetical protein